MLHDIGTDNNKDVDRLLKSSDTNCLCVVIFEIYFETNYLQDCKLLDCLCNLQTL